MLQSNVKSLGDTPVMHVRIFTYMLLQEKLAWADLPSPPHSYGWWTSMSHFQEQPEQACLQAQCRFELLKCATCCGDLHAKP